jgi:hypothetical protein
VGLRTSGTELAEAVAIGRHTWHVKAVDSPPEPSDHSGGDDPALNAFMRRDVTRYAPTLRGWLLRSWRVKVAVLVSAVAAALLVVPLVITGFAFTGRLTAKHPLEDLARQAQPVHAHVFDHGLKGNDRNSSGFALGIVAGSPAAVLAVPPPSRWMPRPLPETPNTNVYRSGNLLLTVRVEVCGLAQCRPGDALVYTEVSPTE